jgi:hypothetical protein
MDPQIHESQLISRPSSQQTPKATCVSIHQQPPQNTPNYRAGDIIAQL